MSYGKGGFIGQDGIKAPDAPTIGTASVVSGTSASVTFTAPTDTGASAITIALEIPLVLQVRPHLLQSRVLRQIRRILLVLSLKMRTAQVKEVPRRIA